MLRKKKNKKVGSVLIRVHGDLKGPFTFAQLRGWIHKQELQNCVPAKFIGDPSFKALQALDGWDDEPEDIIHKLPPLIEVEAAKEYHLTRDKKAKAGLSPLVVLAIVALVLSGVGFAGFQYYKGLEAKRDLAIQTALESFVNKEVETSLKQFKSIRNDLHVFEWATRGKIFTYEGMAHLELGDRVNARKAFDLTIEQPFQAPLSLTLAQAGNAMAGKNATGAKNAALRAIAMDKLSVQGNYILAGAVSGQAGPMDPFDYNQAIVHYTKLINNYKGRVFHYRLAEVYKRKHDYANAANVYETLINHDTLETDTLVQLAMCYLELDEKDSAMEAFRLAKTMDPSLNVYLNE